MITAGLGHHTSEVAFDNIVAIRKLLLTAEVFYTWILCGTKISVLLMYARIFGLANYFVRASSAWLCLPPRERLSNSSVLCFVPTLPKFFLFPSSSSQVQADWKFIETYLICCRGIQHPLGHCRNILIHLHLCTAKQAVATRYPGSLFG